MPYHIHMAGCHGSCSMMHPVLPAIDHSRFLKRYMFLLIVLCQLSLPAIAKTSTKPYILVLASAPGKNLNWKPRQSSLYKGRTIYVEHTIVKGAPWERLCLGYFDTRKQAASVLGKIQKIYPGAWIHKTSKQGKTRVLSTASTSTAKVKKIPAARASSLPGASSLNEKQLDSLMLRARTDFKKKKYDSSIRYLKAVIAANNKKYSPEAYELLGLARQRNGQKAHAANTYERYLKLYPDNDGAPRVRQRLNGLLTETARPKEKIAMSASEKQNEVVTHGSLSQFYQNHSTTIDDIGSIETLSQLVTLFDMNSAYQSTNLDHRLQFTADHVYDITDGKNDSEFRFIDAYYELGYRKTGTSGRVGRQRLQIAGILQRYDGLSVGYQFTPDMRLNLLGGFPVDFDNKTSINKHKTFYGLTFETGKFLDHWNMNMFYLDQKNDGLTDRNSLGTELRYRDRTKAFFGLIDYDLFYDEINILQLNANISFDHGRSAYMTVLLRQSPLLTTSNALIGQKEQSIEELKKVMNIEQIYQLARDRTASSDTTSIGGSLPLNETFQVSADMTFLRTGDTVASGGVPATFTGGTDYYFSTQLVGNSLMMKRDSNVFGIRYYSTLPSEVISFIVNSRFPVTRNWRVNPRLQYDIRNLNNGENRNLLRAIFRTDYRYRESARFDFEVGYDKNSGETVGQLLGKNTLFFTLGYRWDF
ncbi:MAG: hypothetical protein IMF14_02500 [Proteobacteria bacterium]|nr:hypothetical protein [Pseudomonadota bacterium]